MLGSQIISKINHSLNIGSQVASISHSNVLNSRVEFEASDTEHSMTVHTLQTKYHQLGAPSGQDPNVRLNGQHKPSPNKSAKALQHQDSQENGMPVPRVVLYNPGRVQLEWKQSCRIGAGLVNLGNTCFMNTVIQCLTYCTPLANYLLHEEEHALKCKLTGFCMLCEMQKHMKRVLERPGQAIKPTNIYQKLKSIAKHFQFGRQEDAHEFLRYVIDNLWKSCLSTHDGGFRLDPASKETTVVNQIFGGYNRSQVVCLRCHGKSNTFDHFMDLILDIKNVSSLNSALEKFVQAEMLEDENAYKCPKCGTKVRAEKKFTVHKPPNVATFQFKRFDYNRMFGGKITKTIIYPEKLDLRPFMSETQGPPVMYKLNSVLVHMGNTCNSGHYYCFVRNSNGYWYLMDDTRVHQVSLDQVLQQQAYVLFYVRVPSQDCFKKSLHNANVDSKVSAPLKNGTNVPQKPLAHRPTALLQNGSCSKHNNPSLKLCHSSNSLVQHPRQKISFDIRRPSTPSVATNGPQQQQKPDNSAKTLVPYGGDSSESSDDEKSRKNVPNGVQNVPIPDLDNKRSATPKDTFEHPNSLERSSLPKIGIGVVNPRSKSTANWNVIDSNLQSPSVASESSNTSINSTTDWSVMDQDSGGKSKERAYVGWSVNSQKDSTDKVQDETAQNKLDSDLANANECAHRTSVVNGDPIANEDVKHPNMTDKEEPCVPLVNGSTGESNRREVHHHGNDRKRTWTHPLDGQSRGHKHYRDDRYGRDNRWQQQQGGWDANRNKWKPDFYKNERFRYGKEKKRHGSGTSNSSYETEWIEKTKETVEKEKHRSNFHSGPEKIWDGDFRNGNRNEYKQPGGRWDGSRYSDTVDELLRNSNHCYSNGVGTWDGGRSWIDQEPIRKRHFSDDYDEEYDRGKNRKERKRHNDPYDVTPGGNPFQRFQNAKNNGRPYGGFNTFQQKQNNDSRWHHNRDRYRGNRNRRSFPPHHHNNNNRFYHR